MQDGLLHDWNERPSHVLKDGTFFGRRNALKELLEARQVSRMLTHTVEQHKLLPIELGAHGVALRCRGHILEVNEHISATRMPQQLRDMTLELRNKSYITINSGFNGESYN